MPFEQLLAVLPAASRAALPPVFHELMISSESAIIDFYPSEFESDLNGKTQDWEALVLISFIDENRLRDAMAPLLPKLSPAETARNIHSPALCAFFEPSLEPSTYVSPLDNFPDIEGSRVEQTFAATQLGKAIQF